MPPKLAKDQKKKVLIVDYISPSPFRPLGQKSQNFISLSQIFSDEFENLTGHLYILN